jgi:hypothetical protein
MYAVREEVMSDMYIAAALWMSHPRVSARVDEEAQSFR